MEKHEIWTVSLEEMYDTYRKPRRDKAGKEAGSQIKQVYAIVDVCCFCCPPPIPLHPLIIAPYFPLWGPTPAHDLALANKNILRL